MTQTQFIAECTVRTIAPSIALENEAIQEALANRDDQRVINLLDTEF